MLSQFTNEELESRLKELVSRERKLLHIILEHIQEVECRKLYLARAYSSLYEYLVKEFGYSGSAAMRRIEAARLLRQLPEVKEKIQSGDLNLSQIGELSRAIKEKEKHGAEVSLEKKSELIATISGKTTQETQKELSLALDIQIKEPDRIRVQGDDSVRFETHLSKETYELLLHAKGLAAAKLEQESLEVTWDHILKEALETYVNQKLKPTTASVLNRVIAKESDNSTTLDKVNKSITPKMRSFVLKRDGCCQYQDLKTQRMCGSTYNLQVDHKTSLWAGGTNAVENLQALCRAHNNYKYKLESNIQYKKVW